MKQEEYSVYDKAVYDGLDIERLYEHPKSKYWSSEIATAIMQSQKILSLEEERKRHEKRTEKTQKYLKTEFVKEGVLRNKINTLATKLQEDELTQDKKNRFVDRLIDAEQKYHELTNSYLYY